MNELSVLTSFGDLIVGGLLTLCFAGLAIGLHRLNERLAAQTQHMEDLQGAVAAYGQSLITSRAMLEHMEARLGAFTDQNLEIQSQLAFNRSFEAASRLVRDGGSLEALINDCGLSAAEAALMIRLHQRDEEKSGTHRQQPVALPLGDQAVGAVPDNEPSDAPLTSEEIRLQESLARAQSR